MHGRLKFRPARFDLSTILRMGIQGPAREIWVIDLVKAQKPKDVMMNP